MTSCPKIETCHPECIDESAREKPGGCINEMVIYSFYYVFGERLGAFPAPSLAFGSRSKNFPISSTEV
jgi:hypothetical protein